MLFQAHSGLRYAVLLAGLVALVILLTGRFGHRPYGRGANLSGAIFTGLLDLQVLLGIGTVALRPWYPALIGHIALMVLALVAAHIFRARAKRADNDARRYAMAQLALVLPLLLILAGVTAIGKRVI
jgi:heme A synthase